LNPASASPALEGYVVILQKPGKDLRHPGIIFDQQDLGRWQIHTLAFKLVVVCSVLSASSRSVLSTFNTNPGLKPN
jgi:hypothetical protein